ncbi:hypothetical protein DLM_1638 [Aquitalea magnusonii]|uniref:Uncharacterized protein n=1 Tax=Aquitalea magnusonii TaxID=332411 RepID=A0A3G9GCT7_9NEIS|nr:hypothetical protein DLM_1638 [Aquitalea magnusonii]
MRKPRPDHHQTGIMMAGQADHTRQLDYQPPDQAQENRVNHQPGWLTRHNDLPALGTQTAPAVAGEYRS